MAKERPAGRYCLLERELPASGHDVASARITGESGNAFFQQDFVEAFDAFYARLSIGQGTGIPRNQIHFDAA